MPEAANQNSILSSDSLSFLSLNLQVILLQRSYPFSHPPQRSETLKKHPSERCRRYTNYTSHVIDIHKCVTERERENRKWNECKLYDFVSKY